MIVLHLQKGGDAGSTGLMSLDFLRSEGAQVVNT